MLQRNTAHHPLVWVIDGTAAAVSSVFSHAGNSVWWSGAPGWLITLVTASRSVVADFGDLTVRLRNPTAPGAGCTFAAVTVTAHRWGDTADEYRARFLDVLGMCAERWDHSEFLEWSLNEDGVTTWYLIGKGTTPNHAVIWVRGSGSVADLVEVHRRADAVGWVLPANVFETHHGSWLSALARREGVFQSVDRWFDKSYARHLVDAAGNPAGPAAEWCNMGRDPEPLIWVQRQLVAVGAGLDVVWAQHKANTDGAWQELKAADTTASRQNLDRVGRLRLIDTWVTTGSVQPPYGRRT